MRSRLEALAEGDCKMYGIIDERNNKRQDWMEAAGEAWITNDENHIFGLVKEKIYNLKTGAVVAEEDKEHPTIDAAVKDGDLWRVCFGTYTYAQDYQVLIPNFWWEYTYYDLDAAGHTHEDEYGHLVVNYTDGQIKRDINTACADRISYYNMVMRLSSSSYANKDVKVQICRNDDIDTEIALGQYAKKAAALALSSCNRIDGGNGKVWPPEETSDPAKNRKRPSPLLISSQAIVKWAQITPDGWKIIVYAQAGYHCWPWINYFSDGGLALEASTWVFGRSTASLVFMVDSNGDSAILDTHIQTNVYDGDRADESFFRSFLHGDESKLNSYRKSYTIDPEGYEFTVGCNGCGVTYTCADSLQDSILGSGEKPYFSVRIVDGEKSVVEQAAITPDITPVQVCKTPVGYLIGVYMHDIMSIDKKGNRTALFKDDYDNQEYVDGEKPKTVNNFRLCRLRSLGRVKKVLNKLLEEKGTI